MAPVTRHYPALEIAWSIEPDTEALELLLAALDDVAPTAIEERTTGVRVFLASTVAIERGIAIVRHVAPTAVCTVLSVSDESWAERSQEALGPVRVGNIVVAPPWAGMPDDPAVTTIRIQPSMGFGTGHHASTRLCLELLQQRSLDGCSVLDVGTGSGVLAIAATRLGARSVLAVDTDDDALISARENLDLNRVGDVVTLRALDVTGPTDVQTATYHLITANLTGAMLIRIAATLSRWLARDGHLIASGFQEDEDDAVVRAMAAVNLVAEGRADEATWIARQFRR